MTQTNFKVYRIRWFMLSIYMLLVSANQLLWITFAPITGDASKILRSIGPQDRDPFYVFYDCLCDCFNSGFMDN